MDFWLVVTMTVFVCLTYGSLVTHEVAMIAGFGMGDTAAAAALSVTAGAALIGAIGAGQLIDRFGFRPSISLGLGLLILGISGFLLLVKYPSQQLMLASAATSGFAIGGFDTCFVAYLKRRFGGAELNRLFGIWYFFALATLLLGPIFTGWLFDVAGTYSLALLAMLISLVAAATLVLWVRPEPRLIAPATLPAH
jgi:MFS family permease